MRLVKVAIVNGNSTVGAFRSNTQQAIALARTASEQHAHVAVLPEGFLAGYSPEDLLNWRGFVTGQWEYLEEFAAATKLFPFPTIFHVGLYTEYSGANYNTLATVCNGRIYGGVHKEDLPTYNVFREGRTASNGRSGRVVNVNGYPFGDVMFETPFGIISNDDCEEAWNSIGRMLRTSFAGSELNSTCNASPFRFGVVETRSEMLSTRSSDNMVAEVYANLVGANDGLIFDGGGFVFVNGRPMLKAERWKEGMQTCIIDLDAVTTARKGNPTWQRNRQLWLEKNVSPQVIFIPDAAEPDNKLQLLYPASKNFYMPENTLTVVNPRTSFFEELEQALTLGTYDYYKKTKAFKKFGNAGSGGVDSAVTSIIEWKVAQMLLRDKGLDEDGIKRELKSGFFTIFSMPSEYNSTTTRGVIEQLADQLGVKFLVIPIQEGYERELEVVRSMLSAEDKLEDGSVADQNLQSRIRHIRMWTWSNVVGGFFPNNPNQSEKATGYGTIGGGDYDAGVLGIIANTPKTVNIAFLEYLGKKYRLPAAVAISLLPPSAELKKGQSDERDLMPYPVIDACIPLLAGDYLMPHEVYVRVRQMFTEQDLLAMSAVYRPGLLKAWVSKFCKLFFSEIYKWVRSPLSLHTGSVDLERERAKELPVVKSAEWLEESYALIDQEPD